MKQINNDKIKKADESFSSKLSFYKLFWIFFIVSVFGFVLEEIVQYVQFGVFYSRKGLIYGPFAQLYGFGAVLLIITYRMFTNKSISFLFLFSAFFGGTFEYLSSVIQQLLFGTVSWEYYNMKYNIQGRTNLLFSFFYGIIGVLFIRYCYPLLNRLLEKVPYKKGMMVTYIVFALMLGDMFISSAAMKREYQRYHGIPATTEFQIFLDQKYPDSFLKSIYPDTLFK